MIWTNLQLTPKISRKGLVALLKSGNANFPSHSMTRNTLSALMISFSHLINDYDDKTKESFMWCATSTNFDGSMKKGKWGRCDEATCDNVWLKRTFIGVQHQPMMVITWRGASGEFVILQTSHCTNSQKVSKFVMRNNVLYFWKLHLCRNILA